MPGFAPRRMSKAVAERGVEILDVEGASETKHLNRRTRLVPFFVPSFPFAVSLLVSQLLRTT